jgi:GTP-binding protein Era
MNQPSPQPFHSAFIALIGRPNSGKSTLLNTIIGEEISIVTALPQTTRNNTRGIYTTDTMQLVFVDTPGVHFGKHALNRVMLQQAQQAIGDDIDLICYVVDLSRDFAEEEASVVELVKSVRNIPRLLIFNKIDRSPSVEKAIDRFYHCFPNLFKLPSIKVSALHNKTKQLFLDAIVPFIPKGPLYFDPDDLTDSTMRQIAAEYIRKQIITVTSSEVPHAVFIEIESYKEEQTHHSISATIHVETRGQRGILVGKAGKVISQIKYRAKKELQKLTGVPVHLSCHIKVSPKWRDNQDFLRRMGVNNYRHRR